MEIYISRESQSFGPYSPDDITEYLRDGSIAETDLAWHEGASDWIPVSSLPCIENLGLRRPPPPPPQDGQASAVVPRKHSRWEDVPWFRKSTVNTVFALVGVFFFGIALLFPVAVVLSGEVYTKKKGPDGDFAKWSKTRKTLMTVIFVCWIAYLVIQGISSV